MEIWKRVMKMIHAWEHTKRLEGTTQQEDEDIFANALNNEFLLLERDKQDHEDWWENAMIDERAEREAELRDSLDKPPRNGN